MHPWPHLTKPPLFMISEVFLWILRACRTLAVWPRIGARQSLQAAASFALLLLLVMSHQNPYIFKKWGGAFKEAPIKSYRKSKESLEHRLFTKRCMGSLFWRFHKVQHRQRSPSNIPDGSSCSLAHWTPQHLNIDLLNFHFRGSTPTFSNFVGLRASIVFPAWILYERYSRNVSLQVCTFICHFKHSGNRAYDQNGNKIITNNEHMRIP